jgi:hypothetical protein
VVLLFGGRSARMLVMVVESVVIGGFYKLRDHGFREFSVRGNIDFTLELIQCVCDLCCLDLVRQRDHMRCPVIVTIKPWMTRS